MAIVKEFEPLCDQDCSNAAIGDNNIAAGCRVRAPREQVALSECYRRLCEVACVQLPKDSVCFARNRDKLYSDQDRPFKGSSGGGVSGLVDPTVRIRLGEV